MSLASFSGCGGGGRRGLVVAITSIFFLVVGSTKGDKCGGAFSPGLYGAQGFATIQGVDDPLGLDVLLALV